MVHKDKHKVITTFIHVGNKKRMLEFFKVFVINTVKRTKDKLHHGHREKFGSST
jgi:hypothetical protein